MSEEEQKYACPCGPFFVGDPSDAHAVRHSDWLREVPAKADSDGTMLAAVQRDLAGINIAEVSGGYTYAAIAVYLAGVIDKRGADDGPSVTAKLADQLGKAMAALTRKGGSDDDKFDEFSDAISVPVRE